MALIASARFQRFRVGLGKAMTADWLWPLGIFFVTRLGLVLVVFLGATLMSGQTPATGWDSHPENLLVNGWARWDSGWYNEIASNGYVAGRRPNGEQSAVFFPLYPILMRGATIIVGDSVWAGFLVSNVAFAVALLALYDMLKAAHGIGTARWTIRLLATFPFAFYFSAVYSESVFLLAVVGAFFFAGRKKWAAAALCAALASAARPYGVLVGAGLVVEYFRQARYRVSAVRPDALWLLLAPAGLLAYSGYLWLISGDPLLFVSARSGNGWDSGLLIQRLTGLIAQLSSPASFMAGRYRSPDGIHLSILLASVGALILQRRRLPPGEWVWAITSLIVVGVTGWGSAGRYVLPMYPVFTAFVYCLRRPAFLKSMLIVNTLLMALFALMYSRWDWVS